MTNHRAFSINTIPYDLHREETICQIATSLAYLDQTCTHLFQRIDDSINEARSKIKAFDSRIGLIDLKINKIKGSTKAIQICSSANYPIPNAVDQEYVPASANDGDDFYDAVKFKVCFILCAKTHIFIRIYMNIYIQFIWFYYYLKRLLRLLRNSFCVGC